MSITTQQQPSPSVDRLRATVAGAVLTPGDAGFDAELTGFNLAATPAASLVVAATCADDVAAAVRYAAFHGLRVGVRATGHGAALEGAGQLIVTTSRMTDVAVDPESRTARVAAGARWRDVAAATAPHGLTGRSVPRRVSALSDTPSAADSAPSGANSVMPQTMCARWRS